MRNFLFDAVTNVCAFLLRAVGFLFSIPIKSLLFVEFALNKSIGVVGIWLAGLAHPSRLKGVLAEEAADPNELNLQSLEISLLQSSWRVRDHAKEAGEWRQSHTDAMEAIGTALLRDTGWDESAVQDHIENIVLEATGQGGNVWFDED